MVYYTRLGSPGTRANGQEIHRKKVVPFARGDTRVTPGKVQGSGQGSTGKVSW